MRGDILLRDALRLLPQGFRNLPAGLRGLCRVPLLLAFQQAEERLLGALAVDGQVYGLLISLLPAGEPQSELLELFQVRQGLQGVLRHGLG